MNDMKRIIVRDRYEADWVVDIEGRPYIFDELSDSSRKRLHEFLSTNISADFTFVHFDSGSLEPTISMYYGKKHK